MARSGLGRGLGNLLSEQAGPGTSTPGPGVSRLMRLPPTEKSAPVLEASTPSATIAPASLTDTATLGLWIADAFLSVIALWLGGFSPMAGQPEALSISGMLVGIAGFLGLVAAGVFSRG